MLGSLSPKSQTNKTRDKPSLTSPAEQDKKKKEEKDSSGEMFESEDKAGQSRRAISFTASLIAPYYGVFILAFVSVHWWWQSI